MTNTILAKLLINTRPSGVHLRVVDFLGLGTGGLARCVCVDCWRSWDEGEAPDTVCGRPARGGREDYLESVIAAWEALYRKADEQRAELISRLEALKCR